MWSPCLEVGIDVDSSHLYLHKQGVYRMCKISQSQHLFLWHIRIIQHPCHDTAKEIKPLRGWITSPASSRGMASLHVYLNPGPMSFLLYLLICPILTEHVHHTCLLSVILCSIVWVLCVLVKEQLPASQWLLYCDYRISWLGPSWFFFFLIRKGSFSRKRKSHLLSVYGERGIYSLLWKFRKLCLVLESWPATSSQQPEERQISLTAHRNEGVLCGYCCQTWWNKIRAQSSGSIQLC